MMFLMELPSETTTDVTIVLKQFSDRNTDSAVTTVTFCAPAKT